MGQTPLLDSSAAGWMQVTPGRTGPRKKRSKKLAHASDSDSANEARRMAGRR
jgi:hypothetical protein